MEGIRVWINRNIRSIDYPTESIKDCGSDNARPGRALELNESALKVDESSQRVIAEKAYSKVRDRGIQKDAGKNS